MQPDDEAGHGRVDGVEVAVDRPPRRRPGAATPRPKCRTGRGDYAWSDTVVRCLGPLLTAPVRAWFETSFAAPTDAQAQGWPAIADGDHTLLLAPTGSGKTLAAFLWAIDRLGNAPVPRQGPALPGALHLAAARARGRRREEPARAARRHHARGRAARRRRSTPPTVAMRTGDTPGKERQQLVRNPPDILITTPESLYLMLTSQAREMLRGVETVIIDEIHALAPTKRGAHLMLSLERLEAITDTPPQRIGLSATQRPLDEIARFLGGQTDDGPRPVTIVDAGSRKELDVEVIVPVDDMTEPGAHARRRARDGRRARPRQSRGRHEHLAARAPAHARADPRAPHHDRVLQRAPPRRAARRAASTSSRAKSSCARTTGRCRASNACRSSPS